MKYIVKFCVMMAAILFVGCSLFSCESERKVNVLIVTGGHDFDKEGFNRLLATLPINYTMVTHPDAYVMFEPGNIKKYRTVLLYDMPDEITDNAKNNFLAMLENGTGLVVLHHAVCSYRNWPEYTRIVGGRYAHTAWMKDTIPQPASTYQHDVLINVRVGELEHPVTEGVKDFQIIDETYADMEILPIVHPLLFTDEPSSSPLVGWINFYRNARIVTLTLGHDKQAWENPVFIKLLSQAILWTAEK